jgi:hypothetical protein
MIRVGSQRHKKKKKVCVSTLAGLFRLYSNAIGTAVLECFFLKRFIAQKIQRYTQGYKIVPLTNLP